MFDFAHYDAPVWSGGVPV